MSRLVEGGNRHPAKLVPARLDDSIAEGSMVRVIQVLIVDLDISGPGFRAEPGKIGRPGYRPTTMLKIRVYGWWNRGTTALVHKMSFRLRLFDRLPGDVRRPRGHLPG